jgi:hypothetical protein
MGRIDPRRAEELLNNNNVHNRSIDHRTALEYAGAMERDEWIVNGESIKISEPDDDGNTRLLDGQHRLQAIVISNIAQELIVVSGLPWNAQETMDQGRRRSLASMVELRGVPYYSAVAGSLNVLARYWLNPGGTFVRANVPPTSRQLLSLLDRHPAIAWAAQQAFRTRHQLGGGGHAVYTALWYLFAQVSIEEARVFMRGLTYGDSLGTMSPTLQLRKVLFRNWQNQTRTPQQMLGALIINTWNAERAGEEWSHPGTGLMWRPNLNQKFPAIDGLDPQDSWENPLVLGDGEKMPEHKPFAPRPLEPEISSKLPPEDRVLEALSWKAMTATDLAKRLGMPAREVKELLARMETNGEVRRGGNSRYRVTQPSLELVA